MLFFFICKRAPLVIQKAQQYIQSLDSCFSIPERSRSKGAVFFFLRNLLISIKFLIFDPLIFYYIIYTACAILGMFNSIFIAFLMLDVFLRYPLILHVFKSIWRPKKQILMTIVLFFIFQYFFTIIAFYYFSQSFNGWCEGLYPCFSVIFDQNFKVFNSFSFYN